MNKKSELLENQEKSFDSEKKDKFIKRLSTTNLDNLEKSLIASMIKSQSNESVQNQEENLCQSQKIQNEQKTQKEDYSFDSEKKDKFIKRLSTTNLDNLEKSLIASMIKSQSNESVQNKEENQSKDLCKSSKIQNEQKFENEKSLKSSSKKSQTDKNLEDNKTENLGQQLKQSKEQKSFDSVKKDKFIKRLSATNLDDLQKSLIPSMIKSQSNESVQNQEENLCQSLKIQDKQKTQKEDQSFDSEKKDKFIKRLSTTNLDNLQKSLITSMIKSQSNESVQNKEEQQPKELCQSLQIQNEQESENKSDEKSLKLSSKKSETDKNLEDLETENFGQQLQDQNIEDQSFDSQIKRNVIKRISGTSQDNQENFLLASMNKSKSNESIQDQQDNQSNNQCKSLQIQNEQESEIQQNQKTQKEEQSFDSEKKNQIIKRVSTTNLNNLEKSLINSMIKSQSNESVQNQEEETQSKDLCKSLQIQNEQESENKQDEKSLQSSSKKSQTDKNLEDNKTETFDSEKKDKFIKRLSTTNLDDLQKSLIPSMIKSQSNESVQNQEENLCQSLKIQDKQKSLITSMIKSQSNESVQNKEEQQSKDLCQSLQIQNEKSFSQKSQTDKNLEDIETENFGQQLKQSQQQKFQKEEQSFDSEKNDKFIKRLSTTNLDNLQKSLIASMIKSQSNESVQNKEDQSSKNLSQSKKIQNETEYENKQNEQLQDNLKKQNQEKSLIHSITKSDIDQNIQNKLDKSLNKSFSINQKDEQSVVSEKKIMEQQQKIQKTEKEEQSFDSEKKDKIIKRVSTTNLDNLEKSLIPSMIKSQSNESVQNQEDNLRQSLKIQNEQKTQKEEQSFDSEKKDQFIKRLSTTNLDNLEKSLIPSMIKSQSNESVQNHEEEKQSKDLCKSLQIQNEQESKIKQDEISLKSSSKKSETDKNLEDIDTENLSQQLQKSKEQKSQKKDEQSFDSEKKDQFIKRLSTTNLDNLEKSLIPSMIKSQSNESVQNQENNKTEPQQKTEFNQQILKEQKNSSLKSESDQILDDKLQNQIVKQSEKIDSIEQTKKQNQDQKLLSDKSESNQSFLNKEQQQDLQCSEQLQNEEGEQSNINQDQLRDQILSEDNVIDSTNQSQNQIKQSQFKFQISIPVQNDQILQRSNPITKKKLTKQSFQKQRKTFQNQDFISVKQQKIKTNKINLEVKQAFEYQQCNKNVQEDQKQSISSDKVEILAQEIVSILKTKDNQMMNLTLIDIFGQDNLKFIKEFTQQHNEILNKLNEHQKFTESVYQQLFKKYIDDEENKFEQMSNILNEKQNKFFFQIVDLNNLKFFNDDEAQKIIEKDQNELDKMEEEIKELLNVTIDSVQKQKEKNFKKFKNDIMAIDMYSFSQGKSQLIEIYNGFVNFKNQIQNYENLENIMEEEKVKDFKKYYEIIKKFLEQLLFKEFENQLDQEIDQKQVNNLVYNNQISQLKTDLDNQQKQVKEKDNTLEELQKQIKDLEEQKSNEIQILTKDIVTKDQEVDQLQQDKKENQQQLEKLNDNISDLKKENESFSQIYELNKKIQLELDQNEEINKIKIQLQDRIDENEKQNLLFQELQSQYKITKKDLFQQQKEIKDLKHQNNRLLSKEEKMKQNYDSRNFEVLSINSQQDMKLSQDFGNSYLFTNRKNELQQMIEQNKKLKNQIGYIQNKFEKHILQNHKQFTSENEKSEKVIKNLNYKINLCKGQISENNLNMNNLQKQNASLKHKSTIYLILILSSILIYILKLIFNQLIYIQLSYNDKQKSLNVQKKFQIEQFEKFYRTSSIQLIKIIKPNSLFVWIIRKGIRNEKQKKECCQKEKKKKEIWKGY